MRAFATTLTLEEADPNLSRIDIFYLDSFGNIDVKTGTPAVNPVFPTLFANELQISPVLVAPGALEPSDIDIEKVYDENTEWNTSYQNDAGNTTVTVTATEEPLTGVRHIKMSLNVPDQIVSYPLHYIGEKYQGGKIFYMVPGTLGRKGLIAAEQDTVRGVYWEGLKGHSNYSTGGRGRLIGDGVTNTAAMMATSAANHDVAKYITELIIDGYDDWFLGSVDEVIALWRRRYDVGNFDPLADYWTSTEYDWNEAERIDWQSGTTHKKEKDSRRNARAIRWYDDTALPLGLPVEYYSPMMTNVLFSAPAEVPVTDGILSFNMKSSIAWRANSILLFELYLSNVRVGSVAMSPATNLFGFKPDDLAYQLVAIQMFNFFPTKTTFDAIKISLTGSWPNNLDLYIDDIRFQYTESPINNEVIVQVPALALLQTGWVEVNGLWQYELINTKIKSNSIVDIIPENSAADIVNAAGIYPETISAEGKVYVFAANQPTGDIGITITIMEANS